MADPHLPHEERAALAGELALGVLEGDARARALRLQLEDPDFAAMVMEWRERLGPLHEGFADAPPPDLWPAIERRLPDAGAVPVRILQRRLRAWRAGALASGVVAAALAVFLVVRPAPPPIEIVRAPDQVSIARLAGEANGALFAANYDPAQGQMRIRAVELAPSTLAPELWVIPADGVPRSLGLIAAQGTTNVAVSETHRALIREGATLAITLEPAAGAPHDRPSSAPIAAGTISTL
ncbi:anti-sigma factor [Sphingomonas psychrotolerans]|uniref:Anti-sigma factor n=1 Tax=Sphingomonas psychrotolerans TaxID=1327635 RepID=A0ABU3N9N9_9SPHN|nr:anti-sigma factor [Sphingomonas psychrotolerans]MDT8760584.1 anti-sigma factor [Sphingomonas psychrotolerans]